MKTFLVPFDFSTMSRAAAEQAGELAQALRGRMVLCYMHHLEHVPPECQTGQYTYEEIKADRARLEAAAMKLRERFPEAVVDTTVQVGPPFQGILDQAERESADMIVMGTHGRTGLSHLVLGSVAEKVVQKAKVPVLVTKDRSAPAKREAA